mmetsp:Transcript_17057/g.28531  ORF Transcript_17057/g.28531 Transcript_17057/m.28531 type:complete len:340 (-) Transcript_17057:81-1100(-)
MEDSAALAEDVRVGGETHGFNISIRRLDGQVAVRPRGQQREHVLHERAWRHLNRWQRAGRRLTADIMICHAESSLLGVVLHDDLLNGNLEGDGVIRNPLTAKQFIERQAQNTLILRRDVGAKHKASCILHARNGWYCHTRGVSPLGECAALGRLDEKAHMQIRAEVGLFADQSERAPSPLIEMDILIVLVLITVDQAASTWAEDEDVMRVIIVLIDIKAHTLSAFALLLLERVRKPRQTTKLPDELAHRFAFVEADGGSNNAQFWIACRFWFITKIIIGIQINAMSSIASLNQTSTLLGSEPLQPFELTSESLPFCSCFNFIVCTFKGFFILPINLLLP